MSIAASQTRNITAQAFLTAVVANVALLSVQVGAFVMLKRRLAHIYSPRTFLPPPSKRAMTLPDGPWKWLPAIMASPSTDIIHKNGLDAYMFLRFIKILIWIFLSFTVLTFAIILPVDVVGISGGETGLDRFTWENISAPAYQDRYAAHIILVYLFTFFVIYLIRREMEGFIDLRSQFLVSKSHSRLAQARTVLVTSVPDDLGNEKAMQRFTKFVPGGFVKAWFYRDTKVLNKLFAQRRSACEKLEAAESRILHRASRAWRRSLVKRTKDEENQDGIEDNHERLRASKELLDQLVPLRRRPWHRTGFLGLFGPKVDTIEYFKGEISRLNVLIAEARKNPVEGKFLGSAFIRCGTQMGAHVLAQCVSHHKSSAMTDKWLEAHPKDVVWGNLDDGVTERRSRFVISWFATLALVIAWAFPVAFVGTLSNVTSLCGKTSWLHFLCKAPVLVRSIVQGVLPPLILAILFALVPYVLQALARYECIPRHSLISISVYRRFYLFLMIHGFLIVTLSSGITTAIEAIIQNPASTIPTLASRLPGASTFFLTYIISQGLVGAGTALIQLAPVLMYFIRKWLMGHTPRQAFSVMFMMPSADFGFVLPILSLLATIGISYSIISPLINLLALISFLCLYLAWKFLLLQVFDQPFEFETGGLYFPIALSYLFVGLYVQQICIGCLFLLRISISRVSSIVEAVLMLALLVMTMFSHIIIYKTFHPITKFLPMSLATEKHAEKEDRRKKRQMGLVKEVEEEIDAFNREGVRRIENSLSVVSHEIRDELNSVAGTPETTKLKGGKDSHEHRRTAVKEVTEDDSSEDELDSNEHTFDHPSSYEEQKWIWIPKDTLGLSTILVEDLQAAGVAASDKGADMTSDGVVEVSRGPPDEPWKGGVDE